MSSSSSGSRLIGSSSQMPAARRTFTNLVRWIGHGPCPIHRMRFVNVRRAAGIRDEDPITLESQLELELLDSPEGLR
jgi:hypothetical protein